MAEIRKAVSISRCTFLIRQLKTTSVGLRGEFRLVTTLWFTESKTDAAGLARFIAGTTGPPVASQLPTKKSRNCGGLHRTARQSRFGPKAPRGRVALFRHSMAAE